MLNKLISGIRKAPKYLGFSITSIPKGIQVGVTIMAHRDRGHNHVHLFVNVITLCADLRIGQ